MAALITTWSIGRSADSQIRLDHGSISRRHAELTRGTDGSYYLIDCGSSHGTFRVVGVPGASWEDASHCFVGSGDRLKFGDYVIYFDELVSMLPRTNSASVSYNSNRAEAGDSRPVGSVVRNPETGEVEPR